MRLQCGEINPHPLCVAAITVKVLWGVKVIHLIDRMDLFKISNFSFGWNGNWNGLV